MEYNNIKFDAIVATPGCGKSYLCDKYPNLFVDVDEERLKCKYIVPENITREELERTKGDRPYPRRAHYNEYIKNLYELLDKYVSMGKILICAPHPEAIDYLVNNNIKFCFVYAKEDMRQELIAKPLALGGAAHKTCDIHEFDHGRGVFFGRVHSGQIIHTCVGHSHHTHVRLNGAEGVVGGLGPRVCQGIKQGAFADIGQPHDTKLHK